MFKKSFINHRWHIAILCGIFFLILFVASPLFNFLINVHEVPAYNREFGKITVNGASVFAEVVRSEENRARGLSGRVRMGSENGMLFVFDEYGYHSLWMKQMNFPIDIIWIAGNRIVDIEERVPAPSPDTPDEALPVYRPDIPANLVLEVGAGFVETNKIRIGQTTDFISQEEIDAALAKKELENNKE